MQRWIITDRLRGKGKSFNASLLASERVSHAMIITGKRYISIKYMIAAGINRGFLNIITRPKSTGILGNPNPRARGVPNNRSSTTAVKAPESQPINEIPENFLIVTII